VWWSIVGQFIKNYLKYKDMTDSKIQWWEPEAEFFGDFYLKGDNSKQGYLIEAKQTLAERTKTEVGGVIKLLQIPKGSKILDCPCGYGRHSIELANQGFDVTGVDINSVHLQRAIQNVREQQKNLDFRTGNMLDLNFNSDAVINMFYSFGFFETDLENDAVLSNFYKSLKPGGKFLMHTDVNIPRIIAGKYREDETRDLESGGSLRIIDKYNSETKRIDGSWIIEKNGQIEKKDYSVRVYSKVEFEEMCLKDGFKSVVTYSNWNGDSYSEDSEDMIVVATK
jgi:ubiquinone/menaquinone biosynthesis C-methylase UbiE